MMLAKCPLLDGHCNVVEDALRVVRHRDVFLHHWSIYDRAGRMIPDSGFFRAFPNHESVGGPPAVEPPSAAAHCMPDGDVFWLGFFQVHFGHFLVGTLARLWALAEHADGATRIAYAGTAEPDELFAIAHVRLCLEALGIGREQLVRVEGPMRFPSLTVAEPAFVENFSASPVYGRMMRAIGDRVLGEAPQPTREADIWLSRALVASGNRTIVNEAELTDALARHGIGCEHPERLGFADQLRLWSRTRLALGFASSAFHTSAFRGGRQLCTLSSSPAASSNQALVDRVCGNRSLFLQAIGGLREEAGTVDGFAVSLTIRDPVWLAGELVRVADAFRDRRLTPQAVPPVPRRLWTARTGPVPFGEDMAGQGEVMLQREAARVTGWQIDWKTVRSVCAVTMRDRSGTATPDSLRVEVSGDERAWVAVSAPDIVEVGPDEPEGRILTFRAGYPLPARFLRIVPAKGILLDLGAVAVFGEPLEPEVGLPDALMRAVLAQGAAARPRGIAGALRSASRRIGALLARRSC